MVKTLWADRRKRVLLLTATVLVVVAVAVAGGWMAFSAHALNVAKADCAKAADSARVRANEYNALVNGDAHAASNIEAGQAKDAKTVDTLKKTLKVDEPEYGGCVADDEQGLQDATAKLKSQAKWYKAHEASLSRAVKAVNASKLEKTVDDANALLNDSEGRVQDDATRDELGKAIQARDGQAIADATAKVNESITAKQKADEEAKRKAEEEAAAAAAQAAAAQQSYSTGYLSGSTGYSGGSTGSSSSGSGSSGSSSGSAPVVRSGNQGVGSASDCDAACRAPIKR